MKNPAIVIAAVLGSMTFNPLLAQRPADASATHALTMLEEPKEHGGVQAFSIAADGRWLAGGTGVVTASVDGVATKRSGGDVLIWDARSGKIKRVLGKHPTSVSWLQFTGDGKSVISISGDDGEVRVWSSRGKRKKSFRLGTALSSGLAAPQADPAGAFLVHVEGKTLRGRVVAGRLAVWDLRKGRKAWRLDDSDVQATAISPDGKLLATFVEHMTWSKRGDAWVGKPSGRSLCLYSLGSGEQLWQVDDVARLEQLFFGDNSTVLSVEHESRRQPKQRRGRRSRALLVRRYDVADGSSKAKGTSIAEERAGSLMRVSHDGKMLASIRSMGESLAIYELATGRRVREATFAKGRMGRGAALSGDLEMVAGTARFDPVLIRLSSKGRAR
ncbi:hypothetical protein N8467_00190 [bacterium]|nr:hypothetical protein [bacterium]